MGNTQNTSSSRRSKSDKNRLLEGQDLDDIYALVMEMKQGDDSEAVLKEFVLQQASQIGGDDGIAREEMLAKALGKKSLASKALEPPVRQIVVMRDASVEQQTHRPRISRSA